MQPATRNPQAPERVQMRGRQEISAGTGPRSMEHTRQPDPTGWKPLADMPRVPVQRCCRSALRVPAGHISEHALQAPENASSDARELRPTRP